jgi:hypothetical protein
VRRESPRKRFDGVDVEFVAFLVKHDKPALEGGSNKGGATKFVETCQDLRRMDVFQAYVAVPIAHRRLGDHAEDVAGVDGLAFPGLEAFDFAFFRRANFVLHFHGFNHDESLACFDFVA